MAAAVEHPTKFTFPTLFSKFYGSALPRPYYFPEEKERVDPPKVNSALLQWAAEANWNMGGMNMTRKKLQGKIEGKLEKLDKDLKRRTSSSVKRSAKRRRRNVDSDDEEATLLADMESEESEGEESNDEGSEEEESDQDEGEGELEEGEEQQLEEAQDEPSHIRYRTRSASKKKGKERVRKVLQYPEVETKVEQSAKAGPSGVAPAGPAGSSRTRQLRKKQAATTPKSRTSRATRTTVTPKSGANLQTPSSAKSDAKGRVAGRASRVAQVSLPSASSGASDEVSGASDEETDEDVPETDFSDGSDDEINDEREEEYPATDDDGESD